MEHLFLPTKHFLRRKLAENSPQLKLPRFLSREFIYDVRHFSKLKSFPSTTQSRKSAKSAKDGSLDRGENWPKPSSPFATAKHDLTPTPSRLESHLFPGERGRQGRRQEGWRRRNTSGFHPHPRSFPLLAVVQGVGSRTRG